MFLRSLTLSGFKSFADSATLTFEPGVTVVVGPNGSGKSNVVDAIAWVLGAQSPRVLRGQRMDDVVFAGTDRRSALGRAQVTLVIDNESQALPAPTAEVAITRTLFRSGESEYALNGTPWRLLDLQELLNDAGVGRQQHIIVAQGQIEQVLAAHPEDRRALIEEAAGVLKFRRRKERAQRRLERTEANVTRLVDLQRELRRQLRPLERQAAAARRHRELGAELAQIQLYNAGRELAELQQAQAECDAQRGELAAQRESGAASMAEIDGAIDDAQSQLAQLTAGPDDRLPRVASMSERARGLIGLTYERVRSVERERNAMLDADVMATLTDEHERVTAELAELETAPQQTPSTGAMGDAVDSGDTGHPQVQWTAVQAAETARAEAEARLRAAAAALAESDEHRRGASEELQHWIGRFEALSSAVAAARSDTGAAALGDLAGVGGVLGELVTIDHGWEAAAEAAADGALSAVVVRDDRTAAAALALLADADMCGAVISLEKLPPAGCQNDGTGESLLHADARGDFVRTHLQVATDAPQWCRDRLERLLDAVVGAAICVRGNWTSAYDCALADRASVFVTASGDRFGPRRWRIGTAGTAAAAAVLAQARTRIDELTLLDRQAGTAWASANQAHRAALDACAQAQRSAETLRRRMEAADAQQAAEAQASQDRAAAARRRRSVLDERLRAVSQRLERHESARADASARLDRIDAVVSGLERLAQLLSQCRKRLEAQERQLRARHESRTELVRRLTERLHALRREREAAEAHQEHLRTKLTALDIADAQRAGGRDSVISLLRTELAADPATALAAPPPLLPHGITAAAHEASLRADLRRLGPVNPLALSEFEAASERFDFVAGQLADVRSSRRELNQVIRAIDQEIIASFTLAFDDVARNFAELFETLFPGGTGTLSLTDPHEPLTCGVELDVRPAGKRIGRLSLLSGGERSLVALAYLFAVFRSRPSPFYVLDEVEAALDDVNLQRFLRLVAEFRRESQLIIVSHQRRTMEAADVLYGVSMPPGGTSVVVSERPAEAATAPR
ncbi:chromosome segregation SMC family protein [Candidatus Poriferisodalis sp.]|uniref:chromosome segregation SMC family protein n=1 Tax=Candidatus Poriferisodalis sp. TaxID=3101277 RepID=UPI003B0132B0